MAASRRSVEVNGQTPREVRLKSMLATDFGRLHQISALRIWTAIIRNDRYTTSSARRLTANVPCGARSTRSTKCPAFASAQSLTIMAHQPREYVARTVGAEHARCAARAKRRIQEKSRRSPGSPPDGTPLVKKRRPRSRLPQDSVGCWRKASVTCWQLTSQGLALDIPSA